MRKFSFLVILGFLIVSCSPKIDQTGSSSAQGKKTYKVNTIAFYNLENLFDTINDPNKLDEKSPIMELDPKVRGEVYWKKNHNMAKVISEIGVEEAKALPAIVGVAEIENRAVLEDLINDPQLKNGKYGIVHYDSPDARGIDVALLYRKKIFKVISSAAHETVIYNLDNLEERRPTRDVLLVHGELDGDEIYVLVNHWPSRYGGEKKSRGNREKAAAVNKRLIDSLHNIDPYAKIVIMGDMNDGPTNSSIKNILEAKGDKNNVRTKEIYNPMEYMQTKQGLGTLGYRDSWDLFDQILVSDGLLKNKNDGYQYYKAGIYNPNYLTNPKGRFKGYPFRSYADGQFTGGYSDHFPVYIFLVKEVKE
ncbi:MAG TPA: hypothetical protein VK021_08850 [Flavobacteriaceae bacterium]|nr:hypothetical protein [Flavobacteriaceae bacterium]